MATDSEVMAFINEKMDQAKQEFITDVGNFIDYCIEHDILFPTKEDFDKWFITTKE